MKKALTLVVALMLALGAFVVTLHAGGVQESKKEGVVLRIATAFEPLITNPHRRSDSNATWYSAVFDTLTLYDETNTPQPRLAESWEWNDNVTQLTLHIRQGVKFHTGRELTAADVKWNIERVQDKKSESQLRGSATGIKDIQVPNTYTLILTFGSPTQNIFDMFEAFNIMNPETVEKTEVGEQLDGTGPFVLANYIPGSKLTLKRNENYWQAGKPYLEGIEIAVVPDRDAMTLNLEAGAADLIVYPRVQDIDRLKGDVRYTIVYSENQAPRYFALYNLSVPPFENKLVRQALNYAIPRKRFADTVTMGLTEPSNLPWARVSHAYDEELGSRIRFDLDKARELLAQAGINPADLRFTVVYNANVGDLEPFAVLFQDALKQLGINAKLEPAEGGAYKERHFAQDFDILVGNHNNHMLFPTSLLTQNRPWRISGTSGGYQSERYTALVNAANAELDPTASGKIYREINELIIDEAFTMPFGNAVYTWIMAKEFTGLGYDRFNWMHYENIQVK